MHVSRAEVLRYRVHAQELDAARSRSDVAILDLGVQNTGPDGARWSLELRRGTPAPDDLLLAWTLRGAPHLYRRAEAAEVAAATAPVSDADATKRTLDAGKQLKAAGIDMLDGLAHVAATMREVVTRPMAKGEVSAELTRRLEEPYLRDCVPCAAHHVYEQPFRLAALQAGLELEPDTSPPVLRRIRGWRGPATQVPAHLDPVRAVLHFLGPVRPQQVAGYLDSPVREVKARWPDDAAGVEVEGQLCHILASDEPALATPPEADGVLLLGPFDLFLQARDRELVVPDPMARKDLWRTLGRPGGVLDGHELVGSWRPRRSGKRLRIAVTMWSGGGLPAGMDEQAERLAAFRGVEFAGYAE